MPVDSPSPQAATSDALLAAEQTLRAFASQILTRNSPGKAALIAKADAIKKVRVRVHEFLSDWRKGDFDLPPLAAADARSLEEVFYSANANNSATREAGSSQ